MLRLHLAVLPLQRKRQTWQFVPMEKELAQPGHQTKKNARTKRALSY
jgi:hypothetical protein